VVLSAAITALLCSFGPSVIRRLPEPAVESDLADKVPYPDIAARPGLAVRLAVGGAVVGGLVGWRPGWDSALLPWLYLGAAGVVLAYIDARTRLLPTRIIGPSYAVVAALICVASIVEGSADGLVRAGLGWLAMGGCYVVLWLIYPRGLGYGGRRW
jgi:leader peptidase (prepilin peptidase)/N-methyltransferase